MTSKNSKANGGGATSRVVMAWAIGGVALVVMAVAIVGIRASHPPQPGPMGGLLHDTDTRASGVAAVGGVEVQGAEVELGQVPLNVTVVPAWTLTNTGDQPVTLGEPHASIVEGCCPGPLELTATTLAPGESAELTFPLQMHPGMDGPHDFDIHVPLTGSSEFLTLGVTGDFS